MSEFERTDDEIVRRLSFETAVAGQYLDDDGAILYERIPSEYIERMRSEVGEVENLVEQLPIHLQSPVMMTDEETGSVETVVTSLELFSHDMESFAFRFSPRTDMGSALREDPCSRRFRILFPGFDQALVDQDELYHRKRIAHDSPLWRDDNHKQALMSAYAIMSRLVDADDVCYGSVRAADLSHPEWAVSGY